MQNKLNFSLFWQIKLETKNLKQDFFQEKICELPCKVKFYFHKEKFQNKQNKKK